MELSNVKTNTSNVGVGNISSSRELPMPNVKRISSLNQAHATLQHCWTKLSTVSQQSPSPSPSPVTYSPHPESRNENKKLYQAWLEQWELAFTAFLSNAMASMTNGDLSQSRILKTNHLACTVVASDLESGFEAFEAEFRAIVELAGAVLRCRYFADSPQDTKSKHDISPIAAGLDVREPLRVVLRCSRNESHNKAAELLRIGQPDAV
ncbi:hypothetical protein LTR37_009865 [Vermiconidia calcicola]|uniref:Uncharacterized protein n=1 Tax=Vermiconidia calcicola TaxID=1690605 RepID=A0ACC3N6C7_9PEZI|nr:hypothetical protein LTR37_009865 [Vermiconidia calcicola]